MQKTHLKISSKISEPNKSNPVLYIYQERHGAKKKVETDQDSLNTTKKN